MDFVGAMQIIGDALATVGTPIDTNSYDGAIVKRLEASNTLDDGRSTNQTHIAITGAQMDIFPYLRADGYFDPQVNDASLKKYFIPQIPVTIYESNYKYLSGQNLITEISFENGKKQSKTSVIRSKRKSQADQIQVSLINCDGPEFVAFRKLIHIGAYWILLKKKGLFAYDTFAVIPGKQIEGAGGLQALNNGFFKLPTSTIVSTEDFIENTEHNQEQGSSPLTNVEPIANNIAENILLYGVPGCGKSHTIKKEYCSDDSHMERAVFHPDYTYSDFVGQILPRVDNGHIEYRFEPGPFTRILRKAINTPEETFYLVVEEINRGNAPAIFGDIFQLLDRDESGYSEYGVSNENIARHIYGDESIKIRIPGNLYLLATMNTSDQNVFTLDTAFKRRWTMRMIENNVDACKYANVQICAWGVTWGTFAKTINQKITVLGENNLSNEDNRLGAYFVREADLHDAERFGEKVLMYLWNDAFKFDRDKVFKAEYRTLDQLIRAFVNVGFSVFNEDIMFEASEVSADDHYESDYPTAAQYLEGKNPQLVENYQALLTAVRAKIPNAYDTSVGSLTYAAWKTNDIRKASFADVMIQRNRILIWTEAPSGDIARTVGEQIPVDNHHNHYYKIIFDEAQMEQIVSVIEESYNQLKVQ